MVRAWVWMTPRLTLKVRVMGQRSKSPGKKNDFKLDLTILQVVLGVNGHMGQGQRSYWSRSKVTWVKVSLKVIILAGGLMPTASCIFLGISLSGGGGKSNYLYM